MQGSTPPCGRDEGKGNGGASKTSPRSLAATERVQDTGFTVQEAGSRVQGSRLRVQGSGFRVQSSGFRIYGLGRMIRFMVHGA